jgi:Dolichyl-phosphate-mannose-protein mannosyltransferase
MIVGLVGLLSGYNGRFEFKSGEQYKEDVPYVAMRVMLATFGVLMVPLAWYTSKELGFSNRGAHIVTLMVLCGTSTLTAHQSICEDLFVGRHGMVGNIKVHTTGFNAPLLYIHYGLRFNPVPQRAGIVCLTRRESMNGYSLLLQPILPRLVGVACLYWYQHRLRGQRQMGGVLRHSLSRHVHDRGPLE